MKNTTKIIIGAVIVLIIGAGIYFNHSSSTVKGIAIGTGTPTSFDGISVNGGVRQGVPSSEYPVAPANLAVVGNGLSTLVTSGSLATGTSTLAIIANPFNATSTITQGEVQGVFGGINGSILMGTTSLASINSAANLNGALITSAAIGSSSSYFIASGVQYGPTGQVSAGASSVTEMNVGPNDKIAIYASTTNGYTGNASTTSGTYTIEWQR